MTHIKDLRFHLLVFGSLRNRIFVINAAFYNKSITVHLRAMCLSDRPEILDLEFGYNFEVNIKFSS
jgi:hypothetical protein